VVERFAQKRYPLRVGVSAAADVNYATLDEEAMR
jgi:hypothetical protein